MVKIYVYFSRIYLQYLKNFHAETERRVININTRSAINNTYTPQVMS